MAGRQLKKLTRELHHELDRQTPWGEVPWPEVAEAIRLATEAHDGPRAHFILRKYIRGRGISDRSCSLAWTGWWAGSPFSLRAPGSPDKQ